MPRLLRLDPASGRPLSVFNIDGQYLSHPGAEIRVFIGGAAAGILGSSAERLNVQVPASLAPQTYEVKVAVGNRFSGSLLFQVLGLQQAGISRTIPPAAPGGSLLALDGTNLLGRPGAALEGVHDTTPAVSFPAQGGGTVNANVVSFSPDRLIVQIPPNAASGNISLSTPDGQTSTIPFQVNNDPFGRALPAIPGVQALLNAVKKPVDLAIDPATQLAYVVMSGIARVEAYAVTDVVNINPVAYASVGYQPMHIALDTGRRMGFVSNSLANTVSVFRLQDATPASQQRENSPREVRLAVLQTLPVGRNPLGIAVDPAAGLLAVANNQDDTVSMFHLDTLALVATLSAGDRPGEVAFDSRGRRLYVSSTAGESVAVIDTRTLKSLAPLKVGPGQGAMVFDSLTEKLAIAAADSNTVYIASPASGGITSVKVGARPQDLAVNSLRHSLLVLNLASKSISEVDLAGAAVVSEVPLGASPIALDYDVQNNRGLIINGGGALPSAAAGLGPEQASLAGFSVIRMPAQLNFPRLPSLARGEQVGLAMANLSAQSASVILTALAGDGTRLTGPGLTNPRSLTIGAGTQQAMLPEELFGQAIPADGWVRVQTDAADLRGFFLSFDSNVRYLDGAVENGELIQKGLLPAILAGSGGSTELTLVNENPLPAGAAVASMSGSGQETARATLSVPAFGALRRKVAELFPGADASGYLLIDSVLPIRIYEQFGGSSDIAALNAIKIAEAGSELVFPQFASGAEYSTTATAVNLESEAQQVAVSALDDNGQLLVRPGATNPKSFLVSGKGKLAVDLAKDMGLGGGTLLQGSLRMVSAQGGRLAGYVSYGTSRALVAVAAQPQPRSSMVFSHVAETQGEGLSYFTGVALLNPGSSVVDVQVVVCRPDGSITGTWNGSLPPGGRLARLLRELPGIGNSAMGLTGGYFRVLATQPLYGLAIFGTSDLAALAAIPPQ